MTGPKVPAPKVNEKKKVGRCGLKGVRNLQRYLRYGKVNFVSPKAGQAPETAKACLY